MDFGPFWIWRAMVEQAKPNIGICEPGRISFLYPSPNHYRYHWILGNGPELEFYDQSYTHGFRHLWYFLVDLSFCDITNSRITSTFWTKKGQYIEITAHLTALYQVFGGVFVNFNLL